MSSLPSSWETFVTTVSNADWRQEHNPDWSSSEEVFRKRLGRRSLCSTRFGGPTEQQRKKLSTTVDKSAKPEQVPGQPNLQLLQETQTHQSRLSRTQSQKRQSSGNGSEEWLAWGGQLRRLFGRNSDEWSKHTIHWEPSRIRSPAHDWGIDHMATGFGRVLSCDTSSISISAILDPALRLSSSRKLATLHHNRHRYRRAQPSGGLYTRTTQRLTRSWALKTIGLNRTAWWRRLSCRLLIRRVDTHLSIYLFIYKFYKFDFVVVHLRNYKITLI